MTHSIHHRICPFCEACCGLELTVDNGRVTAVRGHDADVFSRGYVCPKGVAIKDLHDDPDRLRTPLIRRGGRHVEATWDEALAEVRRRLPPLLAAHGRDAVAVTLGNPIAHKLGLQLYVPQLIKALGTRNVYSASTLDQIPKQLSVGWMFGHWLSVPVPDIDRAQFLLIVGANPIASNGSLWTVPDYRGRAKALRARGGRIVVVDPRRTETAEAADEHHFIRPGGDVFLLAAMAQVLFADGRVRLGRLAPLVAGLDALRDAVAPFTPERAADRCGIDPATIRRLAHALADAPSGCVYGRFGTTTQAYGSVCSWLIDALNALAGKLDESGGAMFPKAAAFARNTEGAPGQGGGIAVGRRASRVSGAPEVMGELPMTLLAEEIETPGAGQVRALVTVASNPVLSSPGGPRLARALATLDFMVSVDVYLNETTRHADVVLPGCSPLEDGHYDVAFPQFSVRNHARYSPPVLERPAGARAEWRTLLQLAAVARGDDDVGDVAALDARVADDAVRRAAGPAADAVLAAVAHREGPERLLDLALRAGPYGDRFGRAAGGLTLDRVAAAPEGIDLGPLQPRLPELLRTASGRVELAPPELVADLRRARDALASPPPADAMVLIGRRDVRSNNSWMHNLPLLAKGPMRCTLQLHPDDAAARGLVDGQPVRIRGPQGEGVAPLQITDAVMRGVACLPHGWGHDLDGAQLRVAAERPGTNLNALLDDRLRDPLSGNAVLSGVAVTLAPA